MTKRFLAQTLIKCFLYDTCLFILNKYPLFSKNLESENWFDFKKSAKFQNICWFFFSTIISVFFLTKTHLKLDVFIITLINDFICFLLKLAIKILPRGSFSFVMFFSFIKGKQIIFTVNLFDSINKKKAFQCNKYYFHSFFFKW